MPSLSSITKFRGSSNIIFESIEDVNIALNAGIKFSKLEKIPVANDGTTPFTHDQSFGGNKATDLGQPVLPTDAASKGYVDSIFNGCEQPVDYMVHYLKQTTGSPSGISAILNEICINTIDNNYYIFDGSAWGAPIALSSSNRFIFGISGIDSSGSSGVNVKDNKIYEYNGMFILSYYPHNGCVILIKESSKDCVENSGWIYDADNYIWVQVSSNASSIIAGHGLIKDINTFHLSVDDKYFYFNSSDELSLKNYSIGENKLKVGTGTNQINTDSIPEGSVNKYFPLIVDCGSWSP